MYYRRIIIVVFFLLGIFSNFAQDLEKQKRLSNILMRSGNDFYAKDSFADAEVAFKKAIDAFPNNEEGYYNLANATIKQKRYKEGIAQYERLLKNTKNNQLIAQSFHNVGNAYMGLKKYEKAVEAYKNSLRINSKDEETRYNLALAQDLLKQQQDQQKQQDKKDNKKNKDDKQDKKKEEKDKNKKKEDKKDQNKDKDKKDKDKKDQNKNKKGEEDKKDKDKDKNDKEKDKQKDKGDQDETPPGQKPENDPHKEQPQVGKMSKQQMKQLLDALQKEEKKTQKKINAKKRKGKPVKTEKDW